jgi:hypothetical protein
MVDYVLGETMLPGYGFLRYRQLLPGAWAEYNIDEFVKFETLQSSMSDETVQFQGKASVILAESGGDL